MFEPRPDDDLCRIIRSGTLPDIRDAIQEFLIEDHNTSCSTAMVAAVEARKIEALEVLLAHSEVDEDVVQAAALSEDTSIVELILDRGWDVNMPLCGGRVPSLLSYGVRNIVYLDWLLARPADPNAVSVLNETVLSMAIREGTMKVVKRLMAIENMDKSRGDLLHCAAQREPSTDTVEIIDILITEEGAQVSAYEYDNENASRFMYGFPLPTALHIACERRNIFAIEALLRHGADPRQLKKQGDQLVPPSPIDMVDDDSEIRALLSKYSG